MIQSTQNRGDVLYVLRSSLKDMARSGECKAVAVAIDVSVTLPNSSMKSDAIQVCIEHSGHYSVEVFLPYQLVESKLVYGETFTQQGKIEIFAET